MTRRATYRITRRLGALWKDERGAVAIEFAIVASLLFFLFFTLLDFGRIAFSQVMAEKATHMAARMAAVRPLACNNMPTFPEYHTRGGASPAPRFGSICSSATGTCANPGTFTCVGDATNATANEVWATVEPWLPLGADIDDLRFRYEFDSNLGFLGGPYTPMLTVQLDLPDFQFISPLGALATAAGAATDPTGASFGYPDFSVSLPAEDLALGGAG